jgi:acetyltransferase-like isoleucine patch superfamily enzyme
MKFLRNLYSVVKYYAIKLCYASCFSSKGWCAFSYKSRLRFEKNGRIELDGKLFLAPYSELRTLGQIKIGRGVYINNYSRIVAHQRIEIGSNVLIAQFVTILDHDHAYSNEGNEIRFKGYQTEPVKIGSNVLIGDKVTILKGTVVGDNVIIGANALVKGNIPSNSMVVQDFSNTRIIPINPGDLAQQ